MTSVKYVVILINKGTIMIIRTLFIFLFAVFTTPAMADDKALMLKTSEDLVKQYLEHYTGDIKIPDRFKFDIPDNMLFSYKKFGYSGDYDLWVDPIKPLDKLRWKQGVEDGYRQFEIDNDGVYFQFKKTF